MWHLVVELQGHVTVTKTQAAKTSCLTVQKKKK